MSDAADLAVLKQRIEGIIDAARRMEAIADKLAGVAGQGVNPRPI